MSVNFTNAELTNVLDKITEGTSLSYEVKKMERSTYLKKTSSECGHPASQK
ncbi:MAG: STN domain-containing protein [Phocaeicola vulgatus]|nr:MAG: STN domain-containing protein [Phocaeicola vulgatus]